MTEAAPLPEERICLTGDMACTGLSPCEMCLKFLKEQVLVEAMVRVGGPFTDPEQNPSWPQLLLDKFHDTWEEKLNALLKLLDQHRTRARQAQANASQEAPSPRINPHVAKVTNEASVQPDDGSYHIDDANMEKYMAMVGRVKAGSIGATSTATPEASAPEAPASPEPPPTHEPPAVEPGAIAADDSVTTI